MKMVESKAPVTIPSILQGVPHGSGTFRKRMLRLIPAGAIAFWLTSVATSLLPMAADYRAALAGWSMQTVWFASLAAGLMINCVVSYVYLRCFDRIPARGPVLKSMVVSGCALVLLTIPLDVPQLLRGDGDALFYFMIGFLFNAGRFLLLGAATGWQYNRLFGKVAMG